MTKTSAQVFSDEVLYEDDNERVIVTTTTTIQRIVKTNDGPVIEDEETYYGHLTYLEVIDRVRAMWPDVTTNA
jgi:2-methylisocitrate lyase-like PEP mutase family enzyme